MSFEIGRQLRTRLRSFRSFRCRKLPQSVANARKRFTAAAKEQKHVCVSSRLRRSCVEKMAKSLRSKWKRKMRAEKRKKNAPKELARLKATLGMSADGKGEITMKDVEEVATVVSVDKLKPKNVDVEMEGNDDTTTKMEMDSKRGKKTQLDEHGQYPSWMNQRQAKKLRDRRNAKKGKAKKKKGVAW
ncbi:hypothetical protein GN956_G3631 [Arapaima gigas]